jgi:predicted transcriptional regulator
MPGSLRLPPELEVEIKRLAKLHDRSKNGELIVAVRQYISRCAEEEASEHENDLDPDEIAAECAILHPGLTHQEYEASKKGGRDEQ